jgi:hypothetical protein
MNGIGNTDPTATAGDGDGLDPREAARLLDQAKRNAQREFDLNPPLMRLIGAAVILVGYGALWLSVRGQQPYEGPSLAAIAVVYTAVIVVIAVSAKVVQRATAGVSGRSQQLLKSELAAIVVAYIATGVFQGALRYDGASQAIVYGVFPAAAPLVVVGGTLAGIAGARQDWPMFGTALAVVAVGTGAAFAGPAGAWAVAGVGLFLVALGHAAATMWLRQHVTVRA